MIDTDDAQTIGNGPRVPPKSPVRVTRQPLRHMSLLAQYAAAAAAAAEEERAWMGHKLIIISPESGLRTPECVQRERDPSRSWPLCGPKDVGNAESLWTFRESAECDGALRMTLYGMSVRRVVRWEMNQWAWVSA